ncbi:MAG: rhodanese-like domain-containing protein [Pseudomonadota bacterium]
MSLLSMLSLGKSKPKTMIKQISVTDAHELVLAGRTTLIDVRKLAEWNETGRPQGSHGVTLQDEDFFEKVLKIMGGDKTQPIAFTCRTGGRSSEAAERAKAVGHTDISNVEGGFLAWSAAKLPVDQGPF